MSDHISWETCPRCRRSVAVGWIDGHPGEFDCVSRCQLTTAELHQLVGRAREKAALGQGRVAAAVRGTW